MINWYSTTKWLKAYFDECGAKDMCTGALSRKDVPNALDYQRKKKSWSNATYNNNLAYLSMLFSWLEEEGYTKEKLHLKKKETVTGESYNPYVV